MLCVQVRSRLFPAPNYSTAPHWVHSDSTWRGHTNEVGFTTAWKPVQEMVDCAKVRWNCVQESRGRIMANWGEEYANALLTPKTLGDNIGGHNLPRTARKRKTICLQ